MKYIVLLVFSVFIISCNQTNNDNNVTPVNPDSTSNPVSPVRGFIPWWKNDTLIKDIVYGPPYTDSLITFNSGDTSCFYRKGIKYYIWWEKAWEHNGGYPYGGLDDGNAIGITNIFTDSSMSFLTCYIGKNCFDTSTADCFVGVNNWKYWHGYPGNWVTTETTTGLDVHVEKQYDTVFSDEYSDR